MRKPLLLGSCLVVLLSCASTTPSAGGPTSLARSAPEAPPAPASSPQSKEERIRELLDLTNATDMGMQVMNGLIASMKQTMPQVPAEWWEAFEAGVEPRHLEELVMPIYERNFTDHEIDAMLEFYRSPAGRSIIDKLPAVMMESLAAGQEWGRGLAERMLEDLEADGYDVPNRLEL